MSFASFPFHSKVAAGIAAAGYSAPTPIQSQAIPVVLAGKNVMGLAQTGTGKTAAFALPILNRLMQGPRGGVRALIIAPTRELAEQINDTFATLGEKTRLRSLSVYGGVGINPQISRLRQGVEIVVACPGRLLDHIAQGTIDFSHLDVLVLDEADQMFDMGFFPAIRRILKYLPAQRQTLLFSATMPEEIKGLAREVLVDPVTVQVDALAPAATVSHGLYPVDPHLKTPLLLRLLQDTDTGSVLVFTRTKHRAKRLGEQLGKAGYRAASLQGNLSQNKRQAALEGFRDGSFQILVATDIAARGIDVSQVSHVINYDIPDTPEAYIHRIGRTGRAARSGDAFTLVTGDDQAMVRAIERTLGREVERRTLVDFDYEAPAPKKNQEFARPPRQPNRRKKAVSDGAAKKPDATSGEETKRHSSDLAGRSIGAPPAPGNRRRRSRRGGRRQAGRGTPTA